MDSEAGRVELLAVSADRSLMSHHQQMKDAEANCVPCRLCGGKAVISDAGPGSGYYIHCSGSLTFRDSKGCMLDERRLGGWAYNVMEWWNRLHGEPRTPTPDNGLREALERDLERAKDRYANHAIGMEEIRDASWPGDDAVERIRKCAAHWLSGEEEDLDARMRADLRRSALQPNTGERDAESVEREIAGTVPGLPRDLRRAYVESNGNWQTVANAARQALSQAPR